MSVKDLKKKILLLGRAGIGKTSIKKVIFEGMSPNEIIFNPLEPTRGLSPKVYSWLDIEIGVFDSSGQELKNLLQNEEDRSLAFENADIVIYIFDYLIWINDQKSILEEVNLIKDIIEENYSKSSLILFLHKIDLIPKQSFNEISSQINNILSKNGSISIFYSSLFPEYLYSLYNAIYQIISNFSEETHQMKQILDESIGDLSKTLFFITNHYNCILVQSMTKDFDVGLINHLHNLSSLINQSFEAMTEKNEIEHVIISSSDNFNMIIKNLRVKKFDFKNIVCISQNLNANKLILLIGKIRTRINNYLLRGLL